MESLFFCVSSHDGIREPDPKSQEPRRSVYSSNGGIQLGLTFRVKWFPEASRNMKFERLAKWVSVTTPSNMLPSIERRVKFTSLPILSGKFPVNLLWLNHNSSRENKFPISSGITPDNEFSLRSRMDKIAELKNPGRDDGMRLVIKVV
ncbi:stomatal cytokinesis defective / SCD1 protein [Striga asiatica]|uniref:Stomatal cytokinesis defective / SCD1 protein n=1 Tax=Striga asiatica TaxID=4170 RepID=A0A5A7R7Q5_STRAF|nr:stomatal cytokinesis defective / SCD1 protein [Striga asiatica]